MLFDLFVAGLIFLLIGVVCFGALLQFIGMLAFASGGAEVTKSDTIRIRTNAYDYDEDN